MLIALCSVMGLPWFVAATVLSINHVNSLKLESECAAPGDKPQFLGVRYSNGFLGHSEKKYINAIIRVQCRTTVLIFAWL